MPAQNHCPEQQIVTLIQHGVPYPNIYHGEELLNLPPDSMYYTWAIKQRIADCGKELLNGINFKHILAAFPNINIIHLNTQSFVTNDAAVLLPRIADCYAGLAGSVCNQGPLLSGFHTSLKYRKGNSYSLDTVVEMLEPHLRTDTPKINMVLAGLEVPDPAFGLPREKSLYQKNTYECLFNELTKGTGKQISLNLQTSFAKPYYLRHENFPVRHLFASTQTVADLGVYETTLSRESTNFFYANIGMDIALAKLSALRQ